MNNTQINSKEFIIYLEKIKKLYDTDILTFTEFTENKEKFINELREKKLTERKEDFMLNISGLYKSNVINDEELVLIKEIVLNKEDNYEPVYTQENRTVNPTTNSYNNTQTYKPGTGFPSKNTNKAPTTSGNYNFAVVISIGILAVFIIIIAIIISKTSDSGSNKTNTSYTETKSEPIKKIQDNESVQTVKRWINALGSGDFKSAYNIMKGKKWGTYSFFSSTKAYGGITSTKIHSCESLNQYSSSAEVIAEYDSYDPSNSDGKYKQKFVLENTGSGWYITNIMNIDINYYRKK